ncbi:MAG: high-potential iron-sulfur protein [Bdellovibrionales bacterium]|nr:high-potential iron-sulfur protein [Bdellovibrionales bacterium]
MAENYTRRSFFQNVLLGALAIPLITKSSKLFAGESCPTTPPLGKSIAQPGEGMGKTLEYVTDATTSKNAKHETGKNCGNCKFYNAAKAEAGYAPCTMLGMKYVTNCGWCKSYSKKA